MSNSKNADNVIIIMIRVKMTRRAMTTMRKIMKNVTINVSDIKIRIIVKIIIIMIEVINIVMIIM